jgi:hypothetical protein
MTMSRGMTRAERLQEMERIYTQHQGGLTDIEMAERLGVDRTTVYRDRVELETRVPFREVEPGRWAIDRMKYLSSIRGLYARRGDDQSPGARHGRREQPRDGKPFSGAGTACRLAQTPPAA